MNGRVEKLVSPPVFYDGGCIINPWMKGNEK